MLLSSTIRRYLEGQGEHNFPYMYLDTTSNVTVGIGHLIPSRAKALELPFVYRKDQPAPAGSGSPAKAKGSPASQEEIGRDWDEVEKYQQPADPKEAYVARFYGGKTRLELLESEIDSLFDSDVSAKETDLAKVFPSYRLFPDDAQLALLDLAFNRGVAGMLKSPGLEKAVLAWRWDDAAAAILKHPGGARADRTSANAGLFRTAVQQQEAMAKLKVPQRPAGATAVDFQFFKQILEQALGLILRPPRTGGSRK